jgi:ABC-type Zn uptake system ZnuABC Zn-binding protein ZnuA
MILSNLDALRALALLLSSLTIALGLVSCGDSGTSGGGKLVVVGTTTQVGDLLRQVAGGRADVRQILRPNSDPHDYEPRPSDVKGLAEAQLVVRSGGEVDEWLDELVDSAGSDAPVLTLIDRVQTRRDGDDLDPHWWQDPRNAELAVAAIRDGLAKADPAGAAAYRRNAARYLARLRRLDARTASCIRRIPAHQRRLVTTHDALGYYADRYGLDVIGAVLPSLSTQAQPSARDIRELVDQIESAGVRAIYPESSINPKLERAVARESGAKVGAALWADTLGPEGSSGATYVGSIAANTRAIVDGLTGGAVRCAP